MLDQIRSLSGRLGFREGSLEFLAYVVELEHGRVFDRLEGRWVRNPETFYILLSHYAKSDSIPEVGKLIKFRDLPGGYAYAEAFAKRAESPIAEAFGSEPCKLVEAAKPLNGIEARYGDSSVIIRALPKIPLTYVLWGSNEFPACCSILMDASATNYLPTEDIAVLGELTTKRLMLSLKNFHKNAIRRFRCSPE